jgi:itaconate CoA-transferase
LVIDVRGHGGAGHRLTLASERFVGLLAEDVAEVGDRGRDFGTISKIVPRLSGPVTTPRNETNYVATEYGLVNLKALSSTERAAALIKLAHPDYRDWLTDNAQRMHLI